MGKRITDLTESTATMAGDYIAIDNATYGTRKFKPSNVVGLVDLRDGLPYGFKADGSVDYSTQMASWIAEGTGKRLRLPAGIWTGVLAITQANEAITIEGDGPETAWLCAPSATGDAITVTGTVSNYCQVVLRNFGITRWTSSPTSGCGISLKYVSSSVIEHIHGYHQTYGIQCEAVSNSFIQNNILTRTTGADTAVGIRMVGTSAFPSVYVVNNIVGMIGHGGTSYGYTLTGDYTGDVYFLNDQTNQSDYGLYVSNTGLTPELKSLDLHIINFVADQIVERAIALNEVYNAQVHGGMLLMANKGATNYALYLDVVKHSIFNGVQMYGGINPGFAVGLATVGASIDNTISGGCQFDQFAIGALFQDGGDYNTLTGNNMRTCTAKVSNHANNTHQIIKDNQGYVTSNGGLSAAISTGQTIAHGLTGTPTKFSVTPTVTGLSNVYTTVDGTNLTVTFAGGGSNVFSWSAEYKP